MSEDKQIQTREDKTPSFIKDMLKSFDGVKEYAEQICDSGLAPDHFYHKKKNDRGYSVPDKSKPNTGAVILAIQTGQEAGLSVSQSLQQVVPINGLMSIKGDAAKALIMGSSKCAEMKEWATGSLRKGNYAYHIWSKRKDTGEEMEAVFDVFRAKRAGLWISQEDAKKNPKKKYGPWYKYPDRMIRYRALGFIARDLYPDVMAGMVTQEEAMDYEDPSANTVRTETPEGDKAEVKTQETINPSETKNNEDRFKYDAEDAEYEETDSDEEQGEQQEEKPPVTSPSDNGAEQKEVERGGEEQGQEEEKEEQPQGLPQGKTFGKKKIDERISQGWIPEEEHLEKLEIQDLKHVINGFSIEIPDNVKRLSKKKATEIILDHFKKDESKDDTSLGSDTDEEQSASQPQENNPDKEDNSKESESKEQGADPDNTKWEIPDWVREKLQGVTEPEDMNGKRDMQTKRKVFEIVQEYGVNKNNWAEKASKLGLHPKYPTPTNFATQGSLGEIKGLVSYLEYNK